MKYKTTYEWMTRDPERKQLLEEEGFILILTENLVQLMEDQGITRAELAAKLGKSRAFISQMLNGGRNMTLRTLFRISRALGHDATISFKKTAAEKKSPKLAASR